MARWIDVGAVDPDPQNINYLRWLAEEYGAEIVNDPDAELHIMYLPTLGLYYRMRVKSGHALMRLAPHTDDYENITSSIKEVGPRIVGDILKVLREHAKTFERKKDELEGYIFIHEMTITEFTVEVRTTFFDPAAHPEKRRPEYQICTRNHMVTKVLKEVEVINETMIRNLSERMWSLENHIKELMALVEELKARVEDVEERLINKEFR